MIRKIAGKTVSVWNNAKPIVATAVTIGLGTLAQAQTTSSVADVLSAADDGYSVFTKVRPWIIGVVVLGIALGYLGLLRKRR